MFARRSSVLLAPFGFIGLGQMGSRMAPNIFKSDTFDELVVFDVVRDAALALQKSAAQNQKKVTIADSPADVVKRCSHVLTMLPNGKIVSEVYEKHLIPNVTRSSILIDSSTIDSQTPKDIAKALEAAGATFFDAPVSGGVNAAASGALTFMVGAPNAAAFAEAEKILKHFAKSVVHCGAIGAGQVCKLCNNLILGQHMVAVSEAMLMGTRLGVDPKMLAGIFNSSTGRCWSGDSYNPYPGILPNVPASNGYQGGFGAALMLKDLGLALDAAKSVNLDVRGCATAHSVYQSMVQGGKGQLDFSGVLKHIDEAAPSPAAKPKQ